MNLKIWIEAARLRTLPLSTAGIIVGSSLALGQSDMNFNWSLFALLMVTTIALQVLGNFADDLGDFQHGADNDDRVGPQRAVQSGVLTIDKMKKGIAAMAIFAFTIGIIMLIVAFGLNVQFAVFLAIGIAAIIAAIRYTVGRNPFGYRGLGDFMVLIFFGLATVVGSYYILAKQLSAEVWLLGLALGFLSMGVLNVNNLRDSENDKQTGKRTLIVKFGVPFGKTYHFIICISGIAIFIYCILRHCSPMALLWIAVPTALLVAHGIRVLRCADVKTLDPELKKLSLTTFLMSILFAVAIVL